MEIVYSNIITFQNLDECRWFHFRHESLPTMFCLPCAGASGQLSKVKWGHQLSDAIGWKAVLFPAWSYLDPRKRYIQNSYRIQIPSFSCLNQERRFKKKDTLLQRSCLNFLNSILWGINWSWDRARGKESCLNMDNVFDFVWRVQLILQLLFGDVTCTLTVDDSSHFPPPVTDLATSTCWFLSNFPWYNLQAVSHRENCRIGIHEDYVNMVTMKVQWVERPSSWLFFEDLSMMIEILRFSVQAFQKPWRNCPCFPTKYRPCHQVRSAISTWSQSAEGWWCRLWHRWWWSSSWWT